MLQAHLIECQNVNTLVDILTGLYCYQRGLKWEYSMIFVVMLWKQSSLLNLVQHPENIMELINISLMYPGFTLRRKRRIVPKNMQKE